jgi:hypothetical protein
MFVVILIAFEITYRGINIDIYIECSVWGI